MPEILDCLPYFAEGTVVSGFGRGSKELGIPTANFPEEVIHHLPSSFECGVYYGWAKIDSDDNVYKMTMCVGWNPYYHNTVKTMETHIIHQFQQDFYGDHLKIVVLGYLRPMCDFESLDALIAAIHKDIADSKSLLDQPACLQFKDHQFFRSPPAPMGTPVSSAPISTTTSGAAQNGFEAADGKSGTETTGCVNNHTDLGQVVGGRDLINGSNTINYSNNISNGEDTTNSAETTNSCIADATCKDMTPSLACRDAQPATTTTGGGSTSVCPGSSPLHTCSHTAGGQSAVSSASIRGL